MNERFSQFPAAVLRGDYPDPTVVRVGEDYYMTHSSFFYAPGLLIWHSKDLLHWKPVGKALDTFIGNVWAPELVYVNGLFYLYFPCNKSIYVCTASHAEGPWSQPVDLHISGIDPGHLLTPEGKRYLYLNGGKVVELTADGLSAAGEVRRVYEGWPIPEHMIVESASLESPKLLYKDGYYHLISAQGGTAGPATSHMVVSSRSRTPFGPWEHSSYNPIVHTESSDEAWWSKGHGTLVDTPDGRWFIIYHAYEKGYYTLGRMTLLDPVEWTADGWFRVPSGSPVSDIVTGNLDVEPNGLELSDDFSGEKLAWQWVFFKELSPARYHITGGSLSLLAKGTSPADSGPLLCVPPDQAYEAEVEVSVGPQTEAGLILFYNEACFAGIAFTRKELIRLRRGEKGITVPFSSACGRIHLKIRNERQTITMFSSLDGSSWTRFPSAVEVSGYHHNAFGDFVSLRLGLYAAGEGMAEFKRFIYRKLD